MSTSNSTPPAQLPTSPFLSPPILTQAEASSSSPTMSALSQISPSMPSSSSSQHQHAHSVSPESNERQIAEARAFLAASMNNIGSSLDRTLQDRAKNLHENSKVLQKQEKEVGKATEALRKENDRLGKMAGEGGKRVKELGNVQNWAEMLERDFLVLGEWVRLVDGGDEEEGSESEGSWTGSEEGEVGERQEEMVDREEEVQQQEHMTDGDRRIPGNAANSHDALEVSDSGPATFELDDITNDTPKLSDNRPATLEHDAHDTLKHSVNGPAVSKHAATTDLLTSGATESAREATTKKGRGKLVHVDADGDAEMWNAPHSEAEDTQSGVATIFSNSEFRSSG